MDESQYGGEMGLMLYTLVKMRIASLSELKSEYTLSDALRVYYLVVMQNDIEAAQIEEIDAKRKAR